MNTNQDQKLYRKIRNKKTFKRQLIKRFNEVGYEDLELFLNNQQKWNDYNQNDIIKYVNDFAYKSQIAVEAETRQLELYHKIAKLIAPHSENPKSSVPQNESALALNAIAHLEAQPPPKLSDNIDFETLYHNIACMMRGEPVNDVSQSIINILHEAINNVMADVEGVQGKEDIKKMQNLFLTNKFDAFTVDQATELKSILNDDNFNILKLPLEFLIKNRPI